MENEALKDVIEQLGEIGILIKKFSEIASEMKTCMNQVTSDLMKERTGIDEAVKSITSASGKWENKISAVSKDAGETSKKIMTLSASISAINKLVDERLPPIQDLSATCVSLSEKIDGVNQSIAVLAQSIETKSQESDITARMDRIEQVLAALIENDAAIIGLLSSREAVTETSDVVAEEGTSNESDSVNTIEEV